jgi:hypothetical protein
MPWPCLPISPSEARLPCMAMELCDECPDGAAADVEWGTTASDAWSPSAMGARVR